MSCEGCPLFGNCPAAQIGEAAFADTVAAENLAGAPPEPGTEFDLVRLAVSAEPGSLIAERCAQQLAGETYHDEERWRVAADTVNISSMIGDRERYAEPSAEELLANQKPLLAILEADDRETSRVDAQAAANQASQVTSHEIRTEARALPAADKVPEAAVKALEVEGGIEAHVNRYSGRDPSECPMLGSMGRAGLELTKRLEASAHNPNRGKTIGEILAERRAKQAADKRDETKLVESPLAPADITDAIAQPKKITRLPVVEVENRATRDADHAEILRELPEEVLREATVQPEAGDIHLSELRRYQEAEIWQAQIEDQTTVVSIGTTVSADSVNNSSEAATDLVDSGPLLLSKIELNPESSLDLPDTSLSLIEVSAPIEPSEASNIVLETGPSPLDKSFSPATEAFEWSSEIPYSVIAEDLDAENPIESSLVTGEPILIRVASDKTNSAPIDVASIEVDSELMLAIDVDPTIISETADDHPIENVFQAAFSELPDTKTPEDKSEIIDYEPAAALIGVAISVAAGHELIGEDGTSESLISELKPLLIDFESSTHAQVAEVLEAVNQLGAAMRQEVAIKQEALIDMDVLAEQFEPLCRQLLSLGDLTSNEAVIKAVALEMATTAIRPTDFPIEAPDIERLNRLGTKEYKRTLAAIHQTQTGSSVRQRMRRLLALGRYILASASGLQPRVALQS